jgi:aminomethyltransferase
VVDESDAWVQLAVQGPLSEEIVAEVLGAGVRGVDTFRVASFEMGGASVLAARTGYTGEDGFEIYAPVSAAEMLFDALVKAGEPHGMALCGLGARDTLRMEARLALYGNDIDESTNPWEAGLGWVVKLDTEDFIGREALSALREQGPERRFRGLVLKGPGVIRSGYDIYVGEERVGRTTSGGIAPTLDDASIGLAYIARDYADAEEVSIDIRGRRIPAAVTTRPFYRRSR